MIIIIINFIVIYFFSLKKYKAMKLWKANMYILIYCGLLNEYLCMYAWMSVCPYMHVYACMNVNANANV